MTSECAAADRASEQEILADFSPPASEGFRAVIAFAAASSEEDLPLG